MMAIKLDMTEVSFVRTIIKTLASVRGKREFLDNAIKIV